MIDPPDHSDSNLSLSGCSAFARFPLSWREARQIQDESALERGRPSRLERSVRGRLIPARPLGWPLGRRTVCTSLTLAWVPPGEFAMGCQSQAGGVGVGPTPGWISEPVHPVLLTEGFYLGVCPVTQEQFTAVMGYRRGRFQGVNLPVESVTWREAAVFCERLSQLTQRRFRLPTEAEWEFACRAGTPTAYYLGSGIGDLQKAGWCNRDTQGGPQTRPVAQRRPNAWGLYDMHGNVWEWCSDTHSNLSPHLAVNPVGPRGSRRSRRVLRGGSWYDSPRYCRSMVRIGAHPTTRSPNFGFRVAMDV